MYKLFSASIAATVLAGSVLLASAPVSAQSFDSSLIHKAQFMRYYYVHKKTYPLRRNGYVRYCNCYSVSSSSHVFGRWQVSRYNSWNSAVAGRNRLSRARNTCPGVCQRPMGFRGSTSTRPTIRRPNWVAGHRYCKRVYGHRSRAISYNRYGRWNCFRPRRVAQPRTVYRPRGGFFPQTRPLPNYRGQVCIYGIC